MCQMKRSGVWHVDSFKKYHFLGIEYEQIDKILNMTNDWNKKIRGQTASRGF